MKNDGLTRTQIEKKFTAMTGIPKPKLRLLNFFTNCWGKGLQRRFSFKYSEKRIQSIVSEAKTRELSEQYFICSEDEQRREIENIGFSNLREVLSQAVS